MKRDHRPIRMQGTMIWPRGSGGHFLMGQATGRYESIELATNEHKAAGLLWLDLEEQLLTTCDVSLMDEMAGMWYRNISAGRSAFVPRYAGAHTMPVITSKFIDYQTNELVSMLIEPQHVPFVSLLALIKNLLSPGWTGMPYKVTQLINQARRLPFDLDLDEYGYRMTELVRKLWDQGLCPNDVDISKTLLGWRYYLWCIEHAYDPHDISTFMLYFHHRYVDITRDASASTEISTTSYPVHTTVMYDQIFFELRKPHSPMLSYIDQDSVRRYSLRNLDLADVFSTLLPNECRQEISPVVRDARMKLG